MSAPEVERAVKVIPEKRTASFGVPTGEHTELVVKVNLKGIVVNATGTRGGIEIPKTRAAVTAALALFGAVLDELDTQGVTE